jgi:hypothetical protein
MSPATFISSSAHTSSGPRHRYNDHRAPKTVALTFAGTHDTPLKADQATLDLHCATATIGPTPTSGGRYE